MSWVRLNPVQRPGWLMAVLVLAFGLGSMAWGERLPRNDGFGWDGIGYREMVERPLAGSDWISPYSGRRFIPSLAVRSAIESFDLPLDGPTILRTFAVANVGLFLVTLAALLACCRELGIGAAGRWLMFLAFFETYAHLKHYHYAVCQTDVWTTAISAGMLWAFLSRRASILLLLTAAGAFVWPILLHVGSILFLLPRQDANEHAASPSRTVWASAALIGAGASLGAIYLVFVEHAAPEQADQVIRPLVPASILLVGLYLFVAFGPLLAGRTLTDWRAPGWVIRSTAVAAVWAGVGLIRAQIDPLYTKLGAFDAGTGSFLKTILLFAVSKPASFLVAHLAWFGPVVALGLWLWLWPRVCCEARRFGPGLVVVLAAGVVMALSAESRQSLPFFPAFVLLTVVSVERMGWGIRRISLFGAFCLAASRVWLPLNVAPWPAEDRIYEYPMQRFFMGCGYMTTESYVILGGAGITTLVAVGGLTFWPGGRNRAMA